MRLHRGLKFAFSFIALAIVAFTSALDATILIFALPTISADLGATTLETFWAGIAFLLLSVLFLPLHTELSEIFGRIPVLYACMAFFTIGTILVGLAQNPGVLIVGRAVQGIGGGGMEALSEIILTDLTTLKERPLYLGLLSLAWTAGSTAGPIVGGVFTELVSWRWVAWINLPLIGISMVLIPIFLTLTPREFAFKRQILSVDWIGILLFIAGATPFVLAITWGGQLYPWGACQTIFPLVLGIVFLGVFAFYETMPNQPIIPPRIFKTKTASMSFAGTLCHGIILWCVLYYLPIYFEGVKQQSSISSAVHAFPLTFTVAPSAVLGAIVIDRTRQYRWLIWLGWALSTAGLVSLVSLSPNTTRIQYSGLQMIAGTGMGILFPALVMPVQAGVEVDDVGIAVGTFTLCRLIGSTIGLSIGATTFSNIFSLKLRDLPPVEHLKDGNDAISYIQLLKTLPLQSQLKQSILQVYAESLQWVWAVLSVISIVGLVLSLLIKDLPFEREEMGRQGLQESDDERQVLPESDYESWDTIIIRPLPLIASRRYSNISRWSGPSLD